MPKYENYFLRTLDQSSAKELRPKYSGLYKDTYGVYLSGSHGFRGDSWKKADEDGAHTVDNAFTFSKCKNLFSQEDLRYSHIAAVNQEAADANMEELWGTVCYLAKLPDVDPKTFRYVRPLRKRLQHSVDGYYFRDKNSVYYCSDTGNFMFKVQCQNPKSFVSHCAFAHDDNHAFFMGRKIPNSDGKSFRKIDSPREYDYCYADDNFKYENENWVRVRIKEL